jgi:hypothetical protein
MRKLHTPKPKRTNKVTITFSDEELQAIETHIKRYRESSKASVIRKIVVRHIMGRMIEDSPTLFDQNDLDKLIKRTI